MRWLGVVLLLRALLAPAGLSAQAGGWVPFGSASIFPCYSSLRCTGMVTLLAFDSQSPNTIYLGAHNGGIWKTTDAGASWHPLTDTECVGSPGLLGVDPANPAIVYAMADFYYGAPIGCGLLRSADGGQTWAHLREPPTAGKIVFDAATAGSLTSSTLYLAGYYGLYRSRNSGQTWDLVLNKSLTDIVIDPVNPSVLYAAGSQTGSDAGVYKSSDNGSTWTQLDGGLPATHASVALAAAALPVPTIYAAVQSLPRASGPHQVYRSIDGGTTWARVAATGACTYCVWDPVLAVDPSNANNLWLGDLGLFHSVDGGASFTNVPSVHADQRFIGFNPAMPSALYVGNDGGVVRFDGTTPTDLNNNTLNVLEFARGIGAHPTDPSVVVGGTRDNRAIISSNGTWSVFGGGDGSYASIDPINPNLRYAVSNGIPFRSDGASFTSGLDLSGAGWGQLVPSPIAPGTMYFGLNRLYETRDRGSSWHAISPDFGQQISAISVSHSDPRVLYVAAGTAVAVTTDGGTSWQVGDPGFGLIRTIAASPTNSGTVYILGYSASGQNVFKSGDFGRSWQSVSIDVTIEQPKALVIPASGELYVGTSRGIWHSLNDGASWVPFNSGLPLVDVVDLLYQPSAQRVIAATHGRGMYKYELGIAPPTAAKLVVGALPSSPSTSGAALAMQPIISIQDRNGYPVPVGTQVTASLNVISGNGVLGGAVSVSAVNGFVIYSGLRITGTGTFTVTFAATGLTSATSNNVVVTVGAAADSFVVALGADTATQAAMPTGKLTLPLRLDMSKAVNRAVRAMTARIKWDTSHVAFDSVSAAFGSLVSDTSQAAAGSLLAGMTSATGTSLSTTLVNLYLHGKSTGKTLVTDSVTIATDTASTNLLTGASNVVLTFPTRVCFAPVWGDVSGDGTVNIVDAQQIARYSVGLSVNNPAQLQIAGDVNGDASINIVDAQQIARYSVSLALSGISVRMSTVVASYCP